MTDLGDMTYEECDGSIATDLGDMTYEECDGSIATDLGDMTYEDVRMVSLRPTLVT